MPPKYFVWQIAGTESGKSFDRTIKEKEEQRLANGEGMFLWGVGNSINFTPLTMKLGINRPDIIFTHVKNVQDRDKVDNIRFVWQRAKIKKDGKWVEWPMQDGLRVESRYIPTASEEEQRKLSHYALVCYSDTPLRRIAGDSFYRDDLLSLVTGKRYKKASSRTLYTVQLDRLECEDHATEYQCIMRAQAIAPYIVQMHDPYVEVKDKNGEWHRQ